MSLMEFSAFEIAQKVQSGELSAFDVLEAALERVVTVDGRPGRLDSGELTVEDQEKVHAFITLTADRAAKQAEGIDAKRKAGEPLGPLAGVPLGQGYLLRQGHPFSGWLKNTG